jgi:hypothetical protein
LSASGWRRFSPGWKNGPSCCRRNSTQSRPMTGDPVTIERRRTRRAEYMRTATAVQWRDVRGSRPRRGSLLPSEYALTVDDQCTPSRGSCPRRIVGSAFVMATVCWRSRNAPL